MKKTVNHSLLFARAYEQAAGGKIPRESRPAFHLTPLTGWMNDPNGFCYYHGQYHLFYQYNPYDTEWDAMHWGHAVSHDLLHWTYLPAALAPDASYDSYGCFSGSAAELPDGRHLLMYTGVRQEGGDKAKEYQTQCIAVGDGTDYKKYEKNPVLGSGALPEGLSPYDFRDPKIWRTEDGGYRCVVGARRQDKRGVLLQYESRDGFEWRYIGVLAENDGRFGLMWECPDFFPLDGKQVLFVSPQDMLPEGFEYHNGNGTVCLTGRMDGDRFVEEHNQAIDYGIDFYAPQTILTPDGRRVMIGWMQNWDACISSRSGNLRSTGAEKPHTRMSCWTGKRHWRVLKDGWRSWISGCAPRIRTTLSGILSCILPGMRNIIPFSATGPMNPGCRSTGNSPGPGGHIFISGGAWFPTGTERSGCM